MQEDVSHAKLQPSHARVSVYEVECSSSKKWFTGARVSAARYLPIYARGSISIVKPR